MKNCAIPIIYGKGISNIRSMQLYLETSGALEQAGPWYKVTLEDGVEHKLKGKNALAEWVRENLQAIQDFLRAKGYLP